MRVPYSGTMYVGGDEYSSTAGGYQIGGDDYADANATCTLPSKYELYEDCSINCVCYSATAPSSWLSDWSCYVELYVNGSQFGDYVTVDRSWFSDGSGSSSREFSIDLAEFGDMWDVAEFEGGDSIEIRFVGRDSGHVNSSGQCVYVKSASFYSAYATELEYTLTYSANGGSYAPMGRSDTPDSSGYVTFTVTTVQAMYTGYTFQGWATSPTGGVAYTAGDTIRTNKDVTLYAVWKQNTYKLSYDDNGADSGAAPTDSTEYTSGSAATVAGNTGSMALEGHVFAGWNTAADGTGTTYAPGDSLTITKSTTLYAVWVLDEQVYIYTGTAWQKGEPEIFNGTAWQSGELALYANNNWNT